MGLEIAPSIHAASADNPRTPVPMKAGDLVYYDTFSGLIPCKVERIYTQQEYPSNIIYTYVRAVVTKSYKGYEKGETIVAAWNQVCPRKSRVLIGHEYRIWMNYHPVVSD
ncbi:hypothetical protein [Nonomuraea typhae]|uniref:Uncharacterized protein n=1 Tax=Nonomuraea typhae TaxID=2603600 RepID=A0ABW7YKY9_9ACTN